MPRSFGSPEEKGHMMTLPIYKGALWAPEEQAPCDDTPGVYGRLREPCHTKTLLL